MNVSRCRSYRLGRNPVLRCALLLLPLLAAAPAAWAIGADAWVTSAPSAGAFPLVAEGRAAPLWVDTADYVGVRRAAQDLKADVERVTGVAPGQQSGATATGPRVVIVGTLGHSAVVDDLVRRGKIDPAKITGQWESFLIEVVAQPLAGVEQALVIAGSDKRGAIYGIYAVSEQIGVSPWAWWADVPVRHRDGLFVQAGRVATEGPVVKYRGIFLNDEAPALSGWVQEKFGGFNHTFYARVFELLLRLRANYLWPAMWQPRAFNDDDPANAKLADDYGIVMGTSHHEPLMRAHDEWQRYGKGPWNYDKNPEVLREFWRGGVERVKNYEKIVTIGMRGDGDEAMSEGTNVALLERIVTDQRKILQEVTGRPPQETPQLWALYKEVQGYYERGMRVPDDVTLLWCDDNWGNIRRLPTPAERARSGGAGVYYHFDYVGGPRNYKWINTVPLTKIWEQMHLAWRLDANRIWIVNVGDLKPMEFPIEFFLTYAWNPARWPYEKLGDYARTWAAREFGPAPAAEVAALINGYTKLLGLRKPEMLAPDTFNLVNYREADRVLAAWGDLVVRAEKLSDQLPAEAHDAFFQLVLYPIKAAAVVQELYVAAGRSQLYVRQGRAGANVQAARVHELFAEDQRLVDAYHALGGGKWNHQMDQINLGYTYWQQPELETAPALAEVRPRRGASFALAIEGSEKAWPSYNAGRAVLPLLDTLAGGTRWVELFNRGDTAFTFKATADQPWVTLAPAAGSVNDATRLEVGVKADAVPVGDSTAMVTIEASTGEKLAVQLPVRRRDPAGLVGFVEVDRHIAIEAPHFSRVVNRGEIEWRTLADFGRTLGGVTTFPVTAPAEVPGGDSPRLEYDVNLTSVGEIAVELQCAPSLDFQSGDGLRLAVSFDAAVPQIVRLDTMATLQTWEKAVGDGVRRVTIKLSVAEPGAHVLKLWRVTPGVVFERIILDAGGVRPSYLGPVESPHLGASGQQLDQTRP